MRFLCFATLCGMLLLILIAPSNSNPLLMDSSDDSAIGLSQSRVGMVQTLTCTNPTCQAQCRGRGYRRGSCQIGRCFCSYV
uniref:Putative defensin 4 n=2 Tax=Anopheles triannulatus TaxID=58253 RepID=A0A2M4B0F8_9DIPT